MKKILRWGLIAILLLIVLGALAVHFFLDGAIKHGVETKGPELARVDVKLEGVHISPLSGSGNLKGLLIGNPEGYKSPHAITVSNASLALKPASLLGDKLIIHSINLQAPDINLEIGLGGNNLSKILDNLNQTTAGSSPNEKEKEKKEGRKMQVDDFLISGAKVHGGLTGVGGAAVTIPDIHLTGLGAGPEGITAAELAKRVLSEIRDKAIAAAGSGLNDLGKGAVDLKNFGGDTNNSTGKALKGLQDVFKKK